MLSLIVPRDVTLIVVVDLDPISQRGTPTSRCGYDSHLPVQQGNPPLGDFRDQRPDAAAFPFGDGHSVHRQGEGGHGPRAVDASMAAIVLQCCYLKYLI